jgi:hypothetical protein
VPVPIGACTRRAGARSKQENRQPRVTRVCYRSSGRGGGLLGHAPVVGGVVRSTTASASASGGKVEHVRER